MIVPCVLSALPRRTDGGAVLKLESHDVAVMAEALHQEIARWEVLRDDHRVHGVLIVGLGTNCDGVMRWFGEHLTTVQR